MITINQCYEIFEKSVHNYHIKDSVNAEIINPYPEGSVEKIVYLKNWIDSVQWHLEDIIRNPTIDSKEALAIKRRIDILNQERTDTVELIDDYFFQQFNHVKTLPNTPSNTESIGWAVDKLSILSLKIYHTQWELDRDDITLSVKEKCSSRMITLNNQKHDLINAINYLIEEILDGRKVVKVYRQLKMYNDPELNPVLYNVK